MAYDCHSIPADCAKVEYCTAANVNADTKQSRTESQTTRVHVQNSLAFMSNYRENRAFTKRSS